MNKKGFTLIELIAVVIIMAIIALIATPNIVSMMDKGKKEDYIADAKEIITKATYMYKQEKYEGKFEETSEKTSEGTNIVYSIKLEDIEGINDYTDPYGFTYNKTESIVKFIEPGTDSATLKERKVKIVLTSNDSDSKCYYLDADKDKIDVNDVKPGAIEGDICTPYQS